MKAIFITLLIISPAIYAAPTSYKLANVELGLSAAQASEALQNYFEIPKSKLIISPALNDPLTGIRMSKTIEYSTPEESVFVGLELTNLEDINPKLVVAFISYTSRETEKGKLSLAVEKFGNPSDVSMSSAGIYLWCEQKQHDRCLWSKPNLAYDSKKFTLSDPTINHDYFEAMVRKSASSN